MVRGALFSALRQGFCLNRAEPSCLACPLRGQCHISRLLATVNEDSPRGIEVSRPCTVEPPLERQTWYEPGATFSFGVTLFGDAADLFPYVVLGAQRMGEIGIGNRRDAPGRFSLERIEAVNSVTGASRSIYEAGTTLVQRPDLPITHDAILEACPLQEACCQVTLEILTPMRLIDDGKLVRRLTFAVLLRRLLRRLTDLSLTATGRHPGFDHEALLSAAQGVRVTSDMTNWVDVPSYSSRQGRFTPIGGLMGEVTFQGEMTPFLPWLYWGTIAHLGKDATKGNGWYRLRWPS